MSANRLYRFGRIMMPSHRRGSAIHVMLVKRFRATVGQKCFQDGGGQQREDLKDQRPWPERFAGKSESLFNYALFALPSAYGMVPSRALAALGFLILGFWVEPGWR